MNSSDQLTNASRWRQKFQLLERCTYFGIVLMLLFSGQAFAQQTTVSGTVRDAGGETLPGVSVILKGTTNGTVTDVKGHYSLKVSSGGGTLVFSYVGFNPAEEKINNRSTIDVVLQVNQRTLNEVVVIGYGTAKRRDLTGAVSSVTGKDIAATPVPNVAQALQGKLSGVSVTSQDGRPGAEVNIRVRGGGSISSTNQPLVVIDGIPGNMADVPADQVESIDVLKDASSTAIYGARGANGVVLITTKGAKAGKTAISVNSYVKYNTPTNYLDALSPYDYLKYVWANSAANGLTYQEPFEKLYGLGNFTGNNPGGIESYRDLPSDDIQRKVYNESVSWNHSLTLTGGTDKTKILFSASYTDDQGMKINSYQKRANASFKLSQKILNNLSFDLNTRYTRTPSMSDESTTSGSGSLLSYSYRFRPIATEHILGDLAAFQKNNIEQYGKNSMWDNYSPAARLSDYEPFNKSQNVIAIGTLSWGVVKGLTYRTDFSAGGTWAERKYWSGAIYNGYMDDTNNKKLYGGSADYRKSDSWTTRWTNTLTFDHSFNKANKITVLAGQEVANSGGTNLAVMANYFPSNFDKETAFANINQFDKAKGTAALSSNESTPKRISSFFGRANYSLLDRYLFTLTFRADGSSTFAPNHRWGYFPAAAAAWRLSDEPFLKDVAWLDNLKLRASYGASGNDNIRLDSWSQFWGSTTDQRFQYAVNHTYQSSYQVASIMANPDLVWETTVTRGLGIDFGLFKSKLSGTIDLYHNSVKNLLMLTSLPGITGFPGRFENVGQTSNKGIELSLSGNIFETKDWRISAGGNINFNRNNIDKLADNVTGLYRTSWAGTATYPADDYILVQGQPVGQVRGLTYDGYYKPEDFDVNNGVYTLKPGVPDLTTFFGVVHGITNADRPSTQVAYPGLPKFKDLDGNNVINEKDIAVIGHMNPVHTGGFNLNVGFKNVDFGLNFNWSYGNELYNANKLASLYGAKEAGVYENKLAISNSAYKIYDIVDGKMTRLKTPEALNAANVNATLPLAYNEIGVASTLGIEDGSFLRLNTLTLGYSIPKRLISKAGLSNLRIYGSIYNVFTLTNYSGLDPEVSVNEQADKTYTYPTIGLDYGAYPRARAFVAGVNVNF